MILVYILILIISCAILAFSGNRIIKSLIRIAQFLKWREFIVTSVLMAFVTSLPELFVGITSTFHKKPQLSFGDVIGSNIAALTLIMGIGALMGEELRFRGKVLQKSSLTAALITPLPLLLMMDGRVSRWDGIILLGALILYFRYLLSHEERFSKIFSNSFKTLGSRFKLFLKDLGMFFLGSCLLLIGAEGVVFSASKIAEGLNLPLVVTGAILVALGTSAPEIAFSIKSVTINHKEMVIGDLIGSVVINSTLVLGLVALISPFKTNSLSPYLNGILFTVAVSCFFAVFARTEQKISKKEAVFLIFLYIIFVITEMLSG